VFVLATCLALGVFSAATSPAARRASPFATQVFQFRLEGSQVVPPVSTDGSGSCTVTLDDQTGAYTVSGNYTCLRGDATSVHFHGPAGIGQEAPVIVGFSNTGGVSGTFSRSGTLTSQQVQDMLNGLIYVQLHSTFRLTGELRGQVVVCSSASLSTRNGSGINPVVLSSPSPPVMNAPWSVDLDCAGHAPSVAVLFVYARPASGPIVGAGEILVRTAGKRLFRTTMPHSGGVVTFGATIPGDPSLCGLSAHAQAVVFGSPGPRLTNALELVLGQ
jgi:hypothetical protein